MGRKNAKSAVERLEAKMVRRLGKSFEASSYGSGPYSDEDAANFLGITPEEAETLIHTGLLRTKRITPRGGWGEREMVTTAEMLRFLEAHGRAWVQTRLAKQVDELRDSVKREVRARFLPKASLQ